MRAFFLQSALLLKDILLLSALVSFVYFLVRAVETKFVKKEELDLKLLAMDGMYVFISSGFAQLVISQMGTMDGLESMMGGDGEAATVPDVFTNNPEF